MPPRIIYEGDIEAAKNLLPLAQNHLHKIRGMAAASGAGVTGQAFSPTDNSYIYGLKVGNTEVLHIFVQPEEPQRELIPPEFTELPDFLNGVTRLGRTVERDIIVNGQHRTVRLFSAFKPTIETATKYEWTPLQWRELKRLTVKPWIGFNIDDPDDNTTQYAHINGSMYSGRMRKLVQVMLGFGRIRPNQIQETNGDRQILAREGVQVRFDYRFSRTHGLFRAPDGVDWLIEVSIINGVLAMPLPLYNHSKGLKNSKWPALKACAEEFGGLPTGIAFPGGVALKRAIARGNILRLATAQDLEPFYKLQPYSSAMGWTFNEAGSEAHNTGWYWHDDGIRRGCHYSINVNIGPLKKDRAKDEPIANGSAVLRRVSEDFLYDPSRAQPPALKFHEPLLGGLLSVEMFPTSDADTSVAHVPGMDTTVHVSWIDNALVLVRYYWNRLENMPNPSVESDEEECMYIGAWKKTESLSPVSNAYRFYTTLEDDRTSFYSMTTTTWTSSSDLGWRAPYFITDWIDPPFTSTVWRERMFEKRVTRQQVFSRQAWNAIVVPSGIRDGYAYYTVDGNQGTFTTEDVSYPVLRDPHDYTTLRYLYLYDGNGCPPGFYIQERGLHGRACCADKFERTVSVTPPSDDYLETITNRCAWEYANEGPWLDLCEIVPLLGYTPISPSPYSLPAATTPPEYKARAVLHVNCEYAEAPMLADPEDRFKWRAKSPNDAGVFQTMACAYSCFGEAHLAYGDTFNVGLNKYKGWAIADETSLQTINFLGVVWRLKPAS